MSRLPDGTYVYDTVEEFMAALDIDFEEEDVD